MMIVILNNVAIIPQPNYFVALYEPHISPPNLHGLPGYAVRAIHKLPPRTRLAVLPRVRFKLM
jgi:hypothetical protein